jgi:hypothetical protein
MQFDFSLVAESPAIEELKEWHFTILLHHFSAAQLLSIIFTSIEGTQTNWSLLLKKISVEL